MIVVTAPTGNIGGQLLASILDGGEPIRVIARDPSRLPAAIRRRVDVVVGSHSRRDVVMKAFEGADSVFWLVAADPRAESARAAYCDFAQAACEAFKSQGVKRVVGVSALGRGWPKDAGLATATLAMDDLIAETGVSYTALACPSFMDNILRQLASIKAEGVFRLPGPADFKAPTCAARDIAAAAARLLQDRSWTGVHSLPILGPQDLSFNDMAEIMAETLGKPIRFEEVPMGDWMRMLAHRGLSEGMAQAMVNILTAKNEGLDKMIARTPLNGTPTSFRTWCGDVLRPALLN